MAIMVKLRPSECPDCFDAFRPTTGEHGTVEKKEIPKRIQKIVELKGSAWAYPKATALKKI